MCFTKDIFTLQNQVNQGFTQDQGFQGSNTKCLCWIVVFGRKESKWIKHGVSGSIGTLTTSQDFSGLQMIQFLTHSKD